MMDVKTKSFVILLIYSNFLVLNDAKKNYIIEIQKGTLDYYNKNYGTNVKFSYTKPNKADVVASASYDVINDNVHSDASIAIETYRSVNNQFKKIPLNIEVNLCDMFEKNLYLEGIKDLLNHGNITPCEVKRGNYYVKDFKPNLDFPPLVPGGSYKAVATIKLKSEELFKMSWYAKLTRV